MFILWTAYLWYELILKSPAKPGSSPRGGRVRRESQRGQHQWKTGYFKMTLIVCEVCACVCLLNNRPCLVTSAPQSTGAQSASAEHGEEWSTLTPPVHKLGKKNLDILIAITWANNNSYLRDTRARFCNKTSWVRIPAQLIICTVTQIL